MGKLHKRGHNQPVVLLDAAASTSDGLRAASRAGAYPRDEPWSAILCVAQLDDRRHGVAAAVAAACFPHIVLDNDKEGKVFKVFKALNDEKGELDFVF